MGCVDLSLIRVPPHLPVEVPSSIRRRAAQGNSFTSAFWPPVIFRSSLPDELLRPHTQPGKYSTLSPLPAIRRKRRPTGGKPIVEPVFQLLVINTVSSEPECQMVELQSLAS